MQNQPEPEISVFELWAIVRNGWVLIAVTATLTLVAALAIHAAVPTKYRAEAVIAEVSAPGGAPSGMAGGGLLGQIGGLAALAGLDGGSLRGRKASGMTILQSRSFIEEFIVANELMPVLYPAVARPPETWEAAAWFRQKVYDVTPTREIPGTMTLSIVWEDPELAAAWANGLVALANELARQRDIEEAERSVAYLNEQIAGTNIVELQRSLFGLLEQEQKTLMLANARESYAFELVDPAYVPTYPAGFSRQQVLVGGLLAGIVFGLLLVFLRAMVRSWRREQER